MAKEQAPVDATYLPELMAEKDSIDPSFVHAVRLISNEIERIKNPPGAKDNLSDEKDMIDAYDTKPSRMALMIKVPVDRYPRFNFVGRLLGPGGTTLQGIQSATNTRIAILGKGSMRDKKKAEELASGGDAKYQHLNLPLHVKISSNPATVDLAHVNIGRASTEIMKLLQHVEEEEGMDGSMGRGMGQRGGMRGRGGRGGLGGRGGVARGGVRGGARGGARGASQRGGAGTRGRGAGRGFAAKVQDPYATQLEEYGYDYSTEGYESYGAEYGDGSYAEAYGAEAYADPYAAGEGSYGAEAAYAADAYTYDGSYDYGNGTADASVGQYGAGKPFRGKMRGGASRGRGASKPY